MSHEHVEKCVAEFNKERHRLILHFHVKFSFLYCNEFFVRWQLLLELCHWPIFLRTISDNSFSQQVKTDTAFYHSFIVTQKNTDSDIQTDHLNEFKRHRNIKTDTIVCRTVSGEAIYQPFLQLQSGCKLNFYFLSASSNGMLPLHWIIKTGKVDYKKKFKCRTNYLQLNTIRTVCTIIVYMLCNCMFDTLFCSELGRRCYLFF